MFGFRNPLKLYDSATTTAAKFLSNSLAPQCSRLHGCVHTTQYIWSRVIQFVYNHSTFPKLRVCVEANSNAPALTHPPLAALRIVAARTQHIPNSENSFQLIASKDKRKTRARSICLIVPAGWCAALAAAHARCAFGVRSSSHTTSRRTNAHVRSYVLYVR